MGSGWDGHKTRSPGLAPFFHVSQVGSVLEILLRENQIIIYQDCKARGEAVGFQILDDLSGSRMVLPLQEASMGTKHESIGEIHQLYPSSRQRLFRTQDIFRIVQVFCSTGIRLALCDVVFTQRGVARRWDALHITAHHSSAFRVLPGTRTFVCSGLSLSKHDRGTGKTKSWMVVMGLVASQGSCRRRPRCWQFDNNTFWQKLPLSSSLRAVWLFDDVRCMWPINTNQCLRS